ncbi:hypothetical protein JK211_13600 [Tatumella sp. JGM130]|uniref:hypothetical protein n=1 Tax=Tatumella sp. JGM130 TaxID=2799797 RepID=UPI001BAF9E1D|nr:hypothetical protein [Tatumella sp. JGM130]MBS0895050.1 hypothetical protein [Tatumella sp. JGM130]
MPKKTRCLPGLLLATLSMPLISQAAEKVVPTHLEPLHHVILENQYLTVMRVMIPPGVSTLFHQQHLDYVNTHIDGSPVTIAYPDKPPVSSVMASGNVKFGAHQGKQDIDKVTNTGQTVNQQVAFEIRQHGPLHFAEARRPALPQFSQVLDKPTVRGWKVTLQPGESTTPYRQHGPGVRVFFTEGHVLISEPGKPNNDRELLVHKGDAFLTYPGETGITDGGDSTMIFNDYELR